MKIKFVLGRTGAGKTRHLYEEMIERAADSKTTCLLIVPEQASLESQYELVKKFPGNCIGNVEVLSFQRLAYRLSDDLGIAGRTLLSDMGKDMILRRIIDNNRDNFPFLSRHIHKSGYMAELRGLMSEFSRYGIDREAALNLIEGLDEGLLKYKFSDLIGLYNHYTEWLSDRYMSGDNLMERLLKVCQKSRFLQEAHIYIDGFYGFTPIQYQLVRKLMTTARQVSVALTVAPEILDEKQLSEHHLYYESYTTYKQLSQMAYDVPEGTVEKKVIADEQAIKSVGALKNSLFQYPYKVYKGMAEPVCLSKAASLEEELTWVRNTIYKLVKEDGYRYRDMVILTGRVDAYRLLMDDVLGRSGMPFYLDEKQKAGTNDGMRFVLSVLKLYRNDMDYESVFEYLKSDYGRKPSDTLDHLENYVLRYGVRGWKQWQDDWNYKVPGSRMTSDAPAATELTEAINVLRESIVTPLLPFRLKGPQTIDVHVKNLYGLLVAHEFELKLEKKADSLQTAGQLDEARIYRQIYEKVMDLLDQLCELGQTSPISTADFYELVRIGIDSLELGRVPATVDQIMVGDLVRSRIRSRKICFIIGVNEGVVPGIKEGAGLITDEERSLLAEKGVNLAPTAKSTLFREQFYIYMAMLGFKERLYLSYTTANEEGKASRPSHVIHMTKAILPELTVRNLNEEQEICLPTPTVAYDYTVHELMYGRSPEPVIFDWLQTSEGWRDRLQAALKVRMVKPEEHLSDSSSLALYGPTLNNSITRLEQFAQCPFAHFMTHGLVAKERENFEITLPHLGMIFHRAIELFSKRMLNRELDWPDITPQIRELWVKEILEEILGDDAYQVFYANDRNRYRIERIQAMVIKALWVIGYQIGSGDFRPMEAEWKFDGNNQPLESLNIPLNRKRRMALRGTIDRVDHHLIQGLEYVTVVDYKSSVHDFELDRFYGGIQLQLVVYMNAACETRANQGKEVRSAGMFYFKIDDPFVSGSRELDLPEYEQQVLSQMRLKGVVLDDPVVIQSLDKTLSGKSKVIPVARKKDGELTKNSKTVSEEAFDVIKRFAGNKVKAIGDAIIAGEIEARPYKMGTKTACEYCQYKSICQFDERLPGCDYREIESMNKEEALEKIRGSVNNPPAMESE